MIDKKSPPVLSGGFFCLGKFVLSESGFMGLKDFEDKCRGFESGFMN